MNLFRENAFHQNLLRLLKIVGKRKKKETGEMKEEERKRKKKGKVNSRNP